MGMLLQLKFCCGIVRDLLRVLQNAQSDLLVYIRGVLQASAFDEIEKRISAVIEEDISFSKNPTQFHVQQIFAVKSGINGLLDVARQQYTALTDGAVMLASSVYCARHVHLRGWLSVPFPQPSRVLQTSIVRSTTSPVFGFCTRQNGGACAAICAFCLACDQ